MKISKQNLLIGVEILENVGREINLIMVDRKILLRVKYALLN